MTLGATRFCSSVWSGRVFGEDLLLDVHGSLQLLICFRSIMVGGVSNGFSLGKVGGVCGVRLFLVGFVVDDGHLFWDCPFPLFR